MKQGLDCKWNDDAVWIWVVFGFRRSSSFVVLVSVISTSLKRMVASCRPLPLCNGRSMTRQTPPSVEWVECDVCDCRRSTLTIIHRYLPLLLEKVAPELKLWRAIQEAATAVKISTFLSSHSRPILVTLASVSPGQSVDSDGPKSLAQEQFS